MIQPIKNRIADVYNEVPQASMRAIQGAIQSTQDAIEEHPGVAVMAAFALGMSVGIGLAALLNCSSAPARSNWSAF